MAFKHIQTELKNGVAYLTLNRAPLNVLNIEMMEEIDTYLEGLKKEMDKEREKKEKLIL
jgi:cyclohexa-1,5-dienecarbonyl-CoA hydratase